jgi:hypothetical protein
VRRSRAWVVIAVGIASILAVPSLVVLVSQALLAGVGAGTLVVAYRFPETATE